MAIDPVCGMEVDEKKKFTSEQGGETFYFCSASCRATLDKDPRKHGYPKYVGATEK